MRNQKELRFKLTFLAKMKHLKDKGKSQELYIKINELLNDHLYELNPKLASKL